MNLFLIYDFDIENAFFATNNDIQYAIGFENN